MTNEQNFIENQLVILTKQTLDIFLKETNPAELIALYIFYYYTAKWQKTNQVKCTSSYVAKGLHWSESKVRKVKKQLIEFGLIQDVKTRDEQNKITGHYIKMNYIFKKETLGKHEHKSHPNDNPQCGNENENNSKSHPNDFAQGGKGYTMENRGTNALSANNLNALSTNNLNALSTGNSNALNYSKNDSFSKNISTIVEYLNEKSGKEYKTKSKDTQKHIKARLKEGYTIQDFKAVIDKKCKDWVGTEWEKYLRPSTLFGTRFEDYLNENFTKQTRQQTSLNFDEAKRKYTKEEINTLIRNGVITKEKLEELSYVEYGDGSWNKVSKGLFL